MPPPRPPTAHANVATDPTGGDLALGSVVGGSYRVIRVVGIGGTGVVYEVEHLRTGQHLALKTLLDPSQAARLEQEGRALAKLKSPHVVKVVDLGVSPVGPYLVMTLLEGKNLRDVLGTRDKVSVEFVANMAVQVAEGLSEAHQMGLVHRDLKPENIHLAIPADDGDLAIATVFDFGVVKMAAPEQPTSPLTRTGSTVGTPYYMSLEQLRGSGTVDAQSDVYALSVLLYECFAKRRPFEAGTLGDLIFAICSTSPPHLATLRPDLPRPVIDLVMSGLSRQKEERPKSMRALAEALQSYADPGFTVWLRTPAPGDAVALASPLATLPLAGPSTETASVAMASAVGAARLLGAVARPTQKLQGITAPPPPATAEGIEEPTSLDGATPVEEDPPTQLNRDTPTEMFVRGVHDEEGPGGPGDVADKTAVLDIEEMNARAEAARSAGSHGLASHIPATAHSQAGLSQSGAPMLFGAPPPPSLGTPSQEFPAMASQQYGSLPNGSLQNAAQPGFGQKVDQALSSLGRQGNLLGERGLNKFRTLSQEQQIVAVVVATAALAIVVVGFAYLLSF